MRGVLPPPLSHTPCLYQIRGWTQLYRRWVHPHLPLSSPTPPFTPSRISIFDKIFHWNLGTVWFEKEPYRNNFSLQIGDLRIHFQQMQNFTFHTAFLCVGIHKRKCAQRKPSTAHSRKERICLAKISKTCPKIIPKCQASLSSMGPNVDPGFAF